MPHPLGTIGLSAGIGVQSTASDYPSHYDELGAGGYRAVADKVALDAIPAKRRRKGMLVRVNQSTGGDGLAGKILYYAGDDNTETNTVTLVGAGGYPAADGWNELQVGGDSLPSQSGNNGKFLKTDGSTVSWATIPTGGTVTSVKLALPTELFNNNDNEVTTSGTLTSPFQTKAINTIFAGPSTGSAAAPTFRSLVAADIPILNQDTTGTAAGLSSILNTNKGGTGLDLSTSGTSTNKGLLYSDLSGNTIALFKSSSGSVNAIPTVSSAGIIIERLQDTIQNIISTTEGVTIINNGVASATFKLGSDSIDTASATNRIKGNRYFNIKTNTDGGKLHFISDDPASAVQFFVIGNGSTSISNTLLSLFTDGSSNNFFSTKTIALPAASGTTTLKTSNLPLDSALASSNANTTIINHASTTAINNMPSDTSSAGNAINYTINQHTFTLTTKSGNQDNVGIGNQNSTINMFRYLLTNSIWRAASGGSGTGYTNGTWELARLYSTGLSSNTSSLSGGSTRISQPGATFFTLANPGHGSAFRVLVGDKTVGLDSITLGYDSITFPTATSTGSSVIGAYSGQTLAFGISATAYSSPTSSPGDITSYLTINTTNNVSLPDSGTATGTSGTSTNQNGWPTGGALTTPITGTQSRSLNWRVRTYSSIASTLSSGTYSFGRNITLNTISKSYPHLSSSSGNVYDFRQRWLLFTYNPSPTANNNPGIVFPDFYNSSTKVLDGSNSSPVRALDILSGDYSTDGTTSLGGQVAVGISLGANEIPSAKVTVGASTSSQAAIRLYSGATVTSPSNGDIWFDGTDLCIRIGGTTKKIAFQP